MLQAKQMTNVQFPLPSIAHYPTCIAFSSFGNLVNVLMIINGFRLVLPLRWSRHWYYPFPGLMVLNWVFCDNNLVNRERQFVRMFHVINEVTIDTCDINQIKENAEVKSRTGDFRSRRYAVVRWSIRSTPPMPVL